MSERLIKSLPDNTTSAKVERPERALARSPGARRHPETQSGTSVNSGRARLIAQLKAEIEAAIVARDEFRASDAHEHLIAVEREQRILATVRRYSE